MRNKIAIVVGVAVLVLVIFGWRLLVSHARQEFSNDSNPGTDSASQIEGILSKPLSVSCVFPDDRGGSITAFIKNGKVKATISTGDYNQVLYRDKTVYAWGDGKGIQATVTPEQLVTVGNEVGIDFTNKLSNYKDYCKDAQISDGIFLKPGNMAFKDYTSLIQFVR